MNQQDKTKLIQEMTLYFVTVYVGGVNTHTFNNYFGLANTDNKTLERYKHDFNDCFLENFHVHMNRKHEFICDASAELNESCINGKHIKPKLLQSSANKKLLHAMMKFHSYYYFYFDLFFISTDDREYCEDNQAEFLDDNLNVVRIDYATVKRLAKYYNIKYLPDKESTEMYLDIMYAAIDHVQKMGVCEW